MDYGKCSKFTNFFENERVFTVKWKNSKGGAYKRDFWAKMEPVYRGQKSRFTLFRPPKRKIFVNFEKAKKGLRDLAVNNFLKIGHFWPKYFLEIIYC